MIKIIEQVYNVIFNDFPACLKEFNRYFIRAAALFFSIWKRASFISDSEKGLHKSVLSCSLSFSLLSHKLGSNENKLPGAGPKSSL
uniref:Uncharacterized protein n=1 Tax=Arundo donax TaxID=35708 RepID=A0A0A8YV06_ARUDO